MENNHHHNIHLPLIQMFTIDRTFGTSIPEDNEKNENSMNGRQTKPNIDFETLPLIKFNNKTNK